MFLRHSYGDLTLYEAEDWTTTVYDDDRGRWQTTVLMTMRRTMMMTVYDEDRRAWLYTLIACEMLYRFSWHKANCYARLPGIFVADIIFVDLHCTVQYKNAGLFFPNTIRSMA